MPHPIRAALDFRGGAATRLKLEPRKEPLDLIVIDHLEKAPTEN